MLPECLPNPDHERIVGQIASKEFPELAVSLSSDVVAELWEYQRFVTTCANAYVQPLLDRYLKRLELELSPARFPGAPALMHSAGRPRIAGHRARVSDPSPGTGPAGGGLATALFGALAGKKDVISFDMGGTTAKACLVEDGRVEVAPMLEAGRVHRFKKGSGLPIKAPVIDMIEIGPAADRSRPSMRWVCSRLALTSAGSDPGPPATAWAARSRP